MFISHRGSSLIVHIHKRIACVCNVHDVCVCVVGMQREWLRVDMLKFEARVFQTEIEFCIKQ